MDEELNGGFTLSFTAFPHEDNPGYGLINQECLVEYEGYEFRIKQLRNNPYTKQVTAISSYFDNSDNRKYDTYGGTHTLDEFLTYALQGTGWTFINQDITESVLIPNFGNDNVVKLVDIIRESFKCDMKIEPNRTLRFAKKLGPDNDFQYRYKHNILAITESIDTTKMKTYIEGFGADGLHVKYTSPLASSPGIGIRHAEPVRDDSFKEEAALLEHLKKQLHDYPESSVELDSIELQDKELGETVWLIHERMGIEYQTRVITKRTKIPKNSSTVVLGNYKPKTLSSALAEQRIEIDRNRKETKSRIDQTNEKIVLEVSRLDGDITEAKSSITVTADEIRSEVSAEVVRLDGSIGTLESSISQTAENITLEVNRLDEDIAAIDLRADGIVLDVQALNTSMGDVQSTLSVQAGLIATKVEANGIMSAIEQSEEEILLSATRINLDGITQVNGTLELGKGWEPGGLNGPKVIRFANAGEISYADGFVFRSPTFGHYFNGNVTFLDSGETTKYTVDFSNVTVKGLNVTASFG